MTARAGNSVAVHATAVAVTRLCCGIDPARAARPFRASRRVHELPTEALLEALSVLALGEAIADVPLAIAREVVTARAQRQLLVTAEPVDDRVVGACDIPCRQRNLMIPGAI